MDNKKNIKKKIPLSEKRLLHDMKTLHKNPIENVYVNWTNDNLYTPTVFMIGPKNTPYENGFYGIKFKFTDKFPFEPPKATYVTTDHKVRMNPNLYACGKVCLSILGTWSGPQWTSVQNLTSIILSILTILNENPIQNEPGYENLQKTHVKNITYNKLIKHANIRVGVIQMLENTPKGFGTLRPQLMKYFMDHYEWYETHCIQNLKTFHKKKIKSPIYRWEEKFNYTELLEKIVFLKQTYENNENNKNKLILKD